MNGNALEVRDTDGKLLGWLMDINAAGGLNQRVVINFSKLSLADDAVMATEAFDLKRMSVMLDREELNRGNAQEVLRQHGVPDYAIRSERMDVNSFVWRWFVLEADVDLHERLFDLDSFLPVETELDREFVRAAPLTHAPYSGVSFGHSFLRPENTVTVTTDTSADDTLTAEKLKNIAWPKPPGGFSKWFTGSFIGVPVRKKDQILNWDAT